MNLIEVFVLEIFLSQCLCLQESMLIKMAEIRLNLLKFNVEFL